MSELGNGSTGIPNGTLSMYYKQAIPVYKVAVPLLLLICLTALFENIILILSMPWVKSWNFTLKLTYSLGISPQQLTYVLTTFTATRILAISDAWYSLTWGLGLLMNSYLRVFGANFKGQDCVMMALEAFRLGSLMTSALHLLIISINHAMGTLRPIAYFSKARQPVLENWIIIVLWLFPPMGFVLLVVLVAPSTVWSTCSTIFTLSLAYRMSVLILICIPLIAMTVVYCMIAHKLIDLHRNRNTASDFSIRKVSAGVVSNTSVTETVLSTMNGVATVRRARRRSSASRYLNTIKSSLLIVCTFLIGWIPGAIWFAITCDTCTLSNVWLMQHRPSLVYTMGITCNLLILSKGIINPFIYGLKVPEVVKALHLMINKFKPKHSPENSLVAL